MKGVYCALCLPCSRRAASVAIRPRTLPSASMTCQRLSAAALVALAMNVDIPDKPFRISRTDVRDFPPGRALLARATVGQVQATVNPNHTHLSGECQANGREGHAV